VTPELATAGHYLLLATACIGPWEDEYSLICFQADLHGEEYYAWGLLICGEQQAEFLVHDRPIYGPIEYMIAIDPHLMETEGWEAGLEAEAKELRDEHGPTCLTQGTEAYKALKRKLRRRKK